jgi:hypothetical protein
MEITAGGAQALMAQEQLEAPQIHTGFQQVTRKRMAERISTLLIIRR